MGTLFQFVTTVAIIAVTYFFKGEIMSALDNLKREVIEAKTVSASAVSLIQGLAQRIRDAAGSEEELQALADSLDSDEQALAAAVTANTPSENQAPAEPV